MKIFITGGTGFIGNRLVECLAESGHELVCLARKSSNLDALKKHKVTIVFGDVSDKSSLRVGMQGCDWVVNLANLFTFWVKDERIYTQVNVEGTRNVLECALETGAAKVVHVSSAVVWGKVDGLIAEQTPLGEKRASKYARTKYEGDQIAWQLYRERGLPLVMVYPTAVVGPNDPKATGRYINNLARRKMPAQVLTNSPFSFVYIGDVCAAIIQALEVKDNLGEKYLVNGANLTFGQINQLVSEIAGVKLPFMHLPDTVTTINARLLTWLSKLTGKPPWLDLSVDQVSLMKQGFKIDGSKAERELGIHYTPIRVALQEAIAA